MSPLRASGTVLMLPLKGSKFQHCIYHIFIFKIRNFYNYIDQGPSKSAYALVGLTMVYDIVLRDPRAGDDSVIMSLYCSCTGSEFSSQNPHLAAHNLL